MRPLGEQCDRAQQLFNFAVRIAVAEYRQRERRFGDEYVARYEFKWRAGRIGDVLVIAGGNDAQPVGLYGDLCRAEDVAGGMKRYLHAAEVDGFAIAYRLRGAGEILAITQPHHVEGFFGGQHRAVAGPCVIRMGVRNQRPFHRPGRIDMKAANFAADTGRGRQQDVLRSHHAINRHFRRARTRT